jgi:nicotinic acid phosphoribosyltransferase
MVTKTVTVEEALEVLKGLNLMDEENSFVVKNLKELLEPVKLSFEEKLRIQEEAISQITFMFPEGYKFEIGDLD